jgi:hypothetical protein
MTGGLVIANSVSDVTVEANCVVIARRKNTEVEGIVAEKAVHGNMVGRIGIELVEKAVGRGEEIGGNG